MESGKINNLSEVLLVFCESVLFLTSSFFSRLSIRSFLDARLALVYLF